MPVPAVVAAILAFIAKRGLKAATRKYGKKAVEEAKERKKAGEKRIQEGKVRKKEAEVRKKEAGVRRKEAEKRIQEGKKSREKQDVQLFDHPEPQSPRLDPKILERIAKEKPPKALMDKVGKLLAAKQRQSSKREWIESGRKKLEDIAPVPAAAESIDILRKKREEGFRKGGKVKRSKPKVRGAGIARKGVRPAKMR